MTARATARPLSYPPYRPGACECGIVGAKIAYCDMHAAAPALAEALRAASALWDASLAADLRRACRAHERASFDAIGRQVRDALRAAGVSP